MFQWRSSSTTLLVIAGRNLSTRKYNASWIPTYAAAEEGFLLSALTSQDGTGQRDDCDYCALPCSFKQQGSAQANTQPFSSSNVLQFMVALLLLHSAADLRSSCHPLWSLAGDTTAHIQ